MKPMKLVCIALFLVMIVEIAAVPVSIEMNLRERISRLIDCNKQAQRIEPEVQPVEPQTVTVARKDFNTSYQLGRAAGEQHSSSGWFIGGVASGFLLGLIGTAIIAVAASGTVPAYIPDEVDAMGYRTGYIDRSKSKNRGAAIGGGLLGTAIIVIIFVASGSE
ncbi:MAG: hypothetical protein K8R90_03390 [Candidatus Cloacimonetes bacterium]|nr:hypothetical protein [Candidatus Cloacimonadota bacterium]